MPRPHNEFPRFSIDKNGRAFTKLDGQFVHLGTASDPQSRIRYAAILTDLAQGKKPGGRESVQLAPKPASALTLAELCLDFATRELPRYSRSERHCFLCAIRITREMFGAVPVAAFGPLMLRSVRDAMVAGDRNAKGLDGKPRPRKPWSRYTTNRQIKRVRSVLSWGASWQLVPQSVVDSLKTIRSLACGETDAAESKPRQAVSQSDIDAVRAVLRQKHRDVFDLLLLTGARPGEIIGLRTGDIERTGDVWRCEIQKHKTARHGKRRVLFFNAPAQLILRKYMTADPAARLFKLRRDNFGHVVKRACGRAGVTPFVPHALRHTVATRLADELGTEAAQRLLGHATAAMTEHYSRGAERQAVEAVRRLA